MKQRLLKAIALLALIASPAVAEAAARGFSTGNVNMRSGPSTAYPAVVVIPNGARVTIHGCLQDRPWCDVSFNRGRGWVSANYVQAERGRGRYAVEPRRYRELGVPIISFELGRYWDQHYRGRDFYGERERWRRPPPRGGYWDAAPPPRRDRDRDGPRADRDRDGRPPAHWDRGRGDDRRDYNRDRRDDRRDFDRDRRDGPPRDRDNDRRRDNDNRDRYGVDPGFGGPRGFAPCPPGQQCARP